MVRKAFHCTVPPEQWAEGERVQAITWDVFRFQFEGWLMDADLRRTSLRQEGSSIDPTTGVVTLTIEADVEPRSIVEEAVGDDDDDLCEWNGCQNQATHTESWYDEEGVDARVCDEHE